MELIILVSIAVQMVALAVQAYYTYKMWRLL